MSQRRKSKNNNSNSEAEDSDFSVSEFAIDNQRNNQVRKEY